jgi:hypothetical protein
MSALIPLVKGKSPGFSFSHPALSLPYKGRISIPESVNIFFCMEFNQASAKYPNFSWDSIQLFKFIEI